VNRNEIYLRRCLVEKQFLLHLRAGADLIRLVLSACIAGDNGGVKIAGGGVRGGTAERKQTRLRARQPASSHPDQPVGQLVEPVKTATK